MVLAALNWVADGTALAFCLIAAGVVLPVRAIVVAYALSQLAVVVPLLPGAIGIADCSMVIALVAAGVRPPDALAATRHFGNERGTAIAIVGIRHNLVVMGYRAGIQSRHLS